MMIFDPMWLIVPSSRSAGSSPYRRWRERVTSHGSPAGPGGGARAPARGGHAVESEGGRQQGDAEARLRVCGRLRGRGALTEEDGEVRLPAAPKLQLRDGPGRLCELGLGERWSTAQDRALRPEAARVPFERATQA